MAIIDERGLTDESRRPEGDDVARRYLDKHATNVSVQPSWMAGLPIQMQSVLYLAARGPDGAGKEHRCKKMVRIYRGTVFRAAQYGRLISSQPDAHEGDKFMDRRPLRIKFDWDEACSLWVEAMEEMPHHYVTHFMHGVEILGRKHPVPWERQLWLGLYLRIVNAMHLAPETEAELDARLSDWGRRDWWTGEDEEEMIDDALAGGPAP